MCWDVGSNGRGPLDAGADSEVRVHLLTEICEGTPSMDSSVDELYLLVACVYLTYTMQVTTFPTELSYKHMCYSLIPGHWCPTGKCVNYDGEHRSTLLHEEPSANLSDENRYAYFHE